jgi:hypothetical protein
MGASGISTSFLELSQTSGQVPHVLLTRSPLGLHQCCHWMDPARLACIRHAASVRPEPGSNSPSRSLRPRAYPEPSSQESRFRRGFLVHRLAPEQTSDVRVLSALLLCMNGRSDPKVVANARTRLFRPLFRFQGAPAADSTACCSVPDAVGGNDARRALAEPHRPVVRLVLCPLTGRCGVPSLAVWGELST